MGFDDVTLVVREAMTAQPERPTSQQVAEACSEVLDEGTLDGLRALGLDDEDFLMAVYAELVSAGIDDPEEYLRGNGILEG
ncbi:MAG TPA: hypothetical protein VMS08_00190 [Candidatus Saccharimonadia bacterium]|nr:hypothetical protein [Candidatus Saccharimonadia bacterium]